MTAEVVLRVSNQGPRLRVTHDGSPVMRVQMQQPRIRISNIGLRGVAGPPDTAPKAVIFALRGGGGPILVGQEFEVPDLPFPATITRWTITANASGSAVVDVRRCTFAQYPTMTSIAGTEKPSLVNQRVAKDEVLSTWNTALAQGDFLRAVVDSIDGVLDMLTLTLWITPIVE